MKKKIYSCLAALSLALGATQVNAQSFDEGKSVVTVGYGFPNLVTSTLRNAYNTAGHTNYSFSAMGPLLVRYEYGLSEKIGFGLAFGYSQASITYNYQDQTTTGALVNYTANVKWTSPSVGARMNIHFATKEKLDPYFGISAGWSGNKLTYTDNNPNASVTHASASFGPIYFALGVGMRYYFTDNIGAYVEFGWDKFALMQAGLAFKF